MATTPAKEPERYNAADLDPKLMIIVFGPPASGKSRLAELLAYGESMSVGFENWHEGGTSDCEPAWRWTKNKDGPGWFLPQKHRSPKLATCIDYEPCGDPSIDHLVVEAIWREVYDLPYRMVFHCQTEAKYDLLRATIPQAHAFKLTT